jgi:peptidoglycan/xylan/chitin deacetylase (PgdA/CDA1 family)
MANNSLMSRMQKHLVVFLITTACSFIHCNNFGQSYGIDNSTGADERFIWPDGKKMALSLTFDDARLSQVDKGIPLLDKYGVKATFYVSPGSMIKRSDKWRMAVLNGHGINHFCIPAPEISPGLGIKRWKIILFT